MPEIPLDIGIVVSSAGVLVTILLFVLKTYGTKTRNTIVQSEVVKGHDETIKGMRANLIDIHKELDKLRAEIGVNRGRIDSNAEILSSLIRNVDRINRYDSDLVGVKKDIEFLKKWDEQKHSQIEKLQRRIENSEEKSREDEKYRYYKQHDRQRERSEERDRDANSNGNYSRG